MVESSQLSTSPSPVGRARTLRRAKLPSCEPCRLIKMACDHNKPICSRCMSRGSTARCVYRKNPFKRQRTTVVQDPPNLVDSSRSPEDQASLGKQTPTFQMRMYPNPGFQGPSSLKTVLDNLGDHLAVRNDSTRSNSGGHYSSRDAVLREDSRKMIDEGVRLLDSFLDYLADDAFRRLFSEWEGSGLENHLGSFLIYPFFDCLVDEVNLIRRCQDRHTSLVALSQRLFEQATQPVEISMSMSLEDFWAQYTGSNLRWETVGLILTLAGIMATEIRVPHALCKTDEEKQVLRTNLVHFSNKCVAFCDSLDTLNDVALIFLYESFLLASAFYGDQSFKAWRRLNHVSSALFAEGLHEILKEEQRLPFFLVQLRKRIFTHIYTSDIAFAVFLGRPPRVNKRFCFSNMPLDIEFTDTHNLVGDALNEELHHLDQHGWNTRNEVRKSSLTRWSMITSIIREDTLEVLLNRNPSNVPDRISDLRSKINSAWAELPSFLTVSTEEVWRRGRSRQEADTLHQIRLFYLQTTFLIEWAALRHGLDQTGALFASASKLLAWVNTALLRREQLSNQGMISLGWRVASCALPAAGALAYYLLKSSSDVEDRQLDPSARRESIENLFVLLAHMGVLHEPGDGNYQLFCQAKTALQSAMDAILSRSTATVTENSLGMLSNTTLVAPDWMLSDHFGFGVDSWIGLPDSGLSLGLDDNMPY